MVQKFFEITVFGETAEKLRAAMQQEESKPKRIDWSKFNQKGEP